MKKFSIIRQYDNNDILGLLFPAFKNMDHLSFEEIDVEWVPGLISASSGTITSNSNFKYSITDVSEYDYVIFPMGKDRDVNIYSGLCTGAGTSILPRVTTTVGTSFSDDFTIYGAIAVDPTKPYLASCVRASENYSVIGVKL